MYALLLAVFRGSGGGRWGNDCTKLLFLQPLNHKHDACNGTLLIRVCDRERHMGFPHVLGLFRDFKSWWIEISAVDGCVCGGPSLFLPSPPTPTLSHLIVPSA